MEITYEMNQFFLMRTFAHIDRVEKYSKRILALHTQLVDSEDFINDFTRHDFSKFEDVEREPYTHLTWKYRTAKTDYPYIPSKEMEDRIFRATWHHMTMNKHHPECWDPKANPEALNSKDRDKPSGVMVDATRMPFTYIASMVADWLAMSEEKSSDINEWVANNVSVRWEFNSHQEVLIKYLVENVKVDSK
jgi:hypothetical protein